MQNNKSNHHYTCRLFTIHKNVFCSGFISSWIRLIILCVRQCRIFNLNSRSVENSCPDEFENQITYCSYCYDTPERTTNDRTIYLQISAFGVFIIKTVFASVFTSKYVGTVNPPTLYGGSQTDQEQGHTFNDTAFEICHLW